MDRHVKWLRRRIIASIATQTAETFAVVAAFAFAILQWRTDEGPLTALFGSVVIAQLVAGARVGHAMRNNPLNYVFMRRYVDQPFSYRVARFQGDDEAHAVAALLPGFAPVATIRDHEADPEPVFDIYHDPSRLVAASISRASGSISLISSLADGRILVTDARSMPPHERLVMCLANDDSVESVIATHRRALSARSDVVELASSAHQVVLDSLALEFDSYQALGPTLSPFLDLEPRGKTWLRLIARIKPSELAELPVRLGPDAPTPAVRASVPAPAKPVVPIAPAVQPADAPQVVVSDVATSEVEGLAVPHVQAPRVQAPEVQAPEVQAPEVQAPEVQAPIVSGAEVPQVVAPHIVAPNIAAPVMAASSVVPTPAAPTAPDFGATNVVADHVDVPHTSLPDTLLPEIAPPAFVTREPDSEEVILGSEPITAEVPIVVFADLDAAVSVQADDQARESIEITTPVATAPLDLAAAIASLSAVSAIETAAAAPVGVEAPSLIDEPVAASPTPADVPAAHVPVPVPVPVSAQVPAPVPEPAVDVVASPVAQAAEATAPLAQAAEATAPLAQAAEATAPLAQAPVIPASVSLEQAAIRAAEALVSVPSEPATVPVPHFVAPVPPASLAEAVVSAPDTAAALMDTVLAQPARHAAPQQSAPQHAAPQQSALQQSAPQYPAPQRSAHRTEHVSDVDPALVPNLSAALGLDEELPASRPRLSAVLRANSAGSTHPPASGKRSRRKSR